MHNYYWENLKFRDIYKAHLITADIVPKWYTVKKKHEKNESELNNINS